MTYLVGYSAHKDDACAVSLACQLARSDGNRVHALTVVPRGWISVDGSATDGEFRAWAAHEGETSAAEALGLIAEYTDIEGSATWVTGRSVPAAIVDQAKSLGAEMIVVGSGVDGAIDLVRLTSKTNRLLHSSPVPVAVAPRGYQAAPDARIQRITLAFRDDDATWKLLDEVAEIAKKIGVELRLLTVALRHRVMVTSPVRADEELVYNRMIDQAEQAQAEAIDYLESKSQAVTRLIATGKSWSDALQRVPWSSGDVLVVGSSATTPLANVFLGSSATKIVQYSPVPVIVVP